ncbi:DUF996 domain-containing protein [Thermococcus sp. AM4]|uniref:DUF996 domain-containing protein n=1 Tax=Thermococcus sp. (strain AM4) TaxID=246969 RepID=UPI000186FE33|nr:DUF996 domain-containing protein [Thermococcus sp. AM4]EEB74804.1 conserved hypothetical protein [Thermococcus sp. AM4]
METVESSFQYEEVDVSTERMLGLIGVLSPIASLIPYIGGAFSLLGWVLVLIALHGIGEKLGDDRPFTYYLYGFIIGFVTLILIVFMIVALQMGGVILALLIGIPLIIASLYYRKEAWYMLGRITGINEFVEASKFLWWGGLTMIILVGFVLLLVAWIYQILGFVNMPRTLKKGRLSSALRSEPYQSW